MRALLKPKTFHPSLLEVTKLKDMTRVPPGMCNVVGTAGHPVFYYGIQRGEWHLLQSGQGYGYCWAKTDEFSRFDDGKPLPYRMPNAFEHPVQGVVSRDEEYHPEPKQPVRLRFYVR